MIRGQVDNLWPMHDLLNACFVHNLGMLVICEYAIAYFAKNPHIAYFPAYDGIFRIAYAKIMPHMQKFAYTPHIPHMRSHFFSIFLVQRCFKTANILAANDYRYDAIILWINWSKKCQNVQKRPINDHNFDSLSLEFAYAGNMRKNMPHICRIYAPPILPNSAYFPHILPPNFPHILRKFSAINQHP